MLLSDAILKGTKETKRASYRLYDPNNQGFCAMGAAAYAAGAVTCEEPADEKNKLLQDAIDEYWLHDLNSIVSPDNLPDKRVFNIYKHGLSLLDFIIIANDDLNWRRDKIGRFVKKLGY